MPSFARELEQTLHNALGEALGKLYVADQLSFVVQKFSPSGAW